MSPSGRATMANAVQCTNVPPGASGSWTTSTSSRAAAGAPDQRSGGEVPAPSHVKRRGIVAPSAGEESAKEPAGAAPDGVADACAPPPQPATATQSAARSG